MEHQTEHFPLDHSLKGNNTIYVACDHRGAQQNYAICLNVNKAYDEGRRAPEDYCSKEIKNGKCYASHMRQEELAAGHTLYYKPRKVVEVKPVEPKAYIVPIGADKTDGYKRGWSHAGAVLGKKETDVPKAIQRPKPVAAKPKNEPMDMAAVVSMMAKEAATAPAVVAEPKPESMLEKARRIREQKGNI